MKKKLVVIVIIVAIALMPVVVLTAKNDIKEYKVKVNDEIKTLNTDYIATSIKNVPEEKEEEEIPVVKEETKEAEKIETKPIAQAVEEVKTKEDYESVREQMAESVPAPEPVTKEEAKKYYVGLTFKGNMSGYGPWQDKSGKWNLVQTSTGHNLLKDGIYTSDAEYGSKLRIVAADTTTEKKDDGKNYYILPTYSIVKCTLSNGEVIIAKVLDRGDKYVGRGKKFEFDLAYASEADATTLTNVSFEILRMGSK